MRPTDKTHKGTSDRRCTGKTGLTAIDALASSAMPVGDVKVCILREGVLDARLLSRVRDFMKLVKSLRPLTLLLAHTIDWY